MTTEVKDNKTKRKIKNPGISAKLFKPFMSVIMRKGFASWDLQSICTNNIVPHLRSLGYAVDDSNVGTFVSTLSGFCTILRYLGLIEGTNRNYRNSFELNMLGSNAEIETILEAWHRSSKSPVVKGWSFPTQAPLDQTDLLLTNTGSVTSTHRILTPTMKQALLKLGLPYQTLVERTKQYREKKASIAALRARREEAKAKRLAAKSPAVLSFESNDVKPVVSEDETKQLTAALEKLKQARQDLGNLPKYDLDNVINRVKRRIAKRFAAKFVTTL